MKKDSWITLGIGALILAGWIGFNAWSYHDWTCAFSRCVKVENVKR